MAPVCNLCIGDREKYLSDKAEFILEEAISKSMFNMPGLLRRGLKTNQRTYQHLKNIIGQVTPNCSEENCQHKSECYQMEADIILIHPYRDQIRILLYEVKKSRGKDFKNTRLVSEAFKQLVRDTKFILSLI